MGSEHPQNHGGLGYYNITPQKNVPTSPVVEAEPSLKKVTLEGPPLAYPLSGAEAPVAGYPVLMGEGPALREGGSSMTPVIHENTRVIGGRLTRKAERRIRRREYRSERRHSRLEGIGAIVTTVIDAVKSKKPKKD